jgi:phosphoribosylformimino-5-aminoimidazole carboxamide ribotide isomerase
MEIIPAIDIIDGKCVRLTQGDYARKVVYHDEPLEMALKFQDHGIKRLHLVDLDGAGEGKVRNWKVLELIASKTSLIVDFGGGIKSENDVNIVFNSGAAFATVGSIAVKNEPEFIRWIKKYGGDKFLLGADVRDEKISIHGWKEQTAISIFDFIRKYLEHGIMKIFCTDIAKDGAMEGPSIKLYEKILAEFPGLHLIASGGVSKIQDVYDLVDLGLGGAIIGKAIYEGAIDLNDLKKLVDEQG